MQSACGSLCFLYSGIYHCSLLTQSAMLTSTLRQSQVEDTMIHAQNKCLILVNKMLSSDYANSGAKNPIMDTELAVTAELFNGRILVADRNFKIVKDTYAGRGEI